MDKIFNAPIINVTVICIAITLIFIVLFFILKQFKNISFGIGKNKINLSKSSSPDDYKKYKFISVSMNYADMKIQAVVDYFYEMYRLQLSSIPHFQEDVNRYFLLLDYNKHTCLEKIKNWIKENGFKSFTEEDTQNYKRDKAESLVSSWERNLNVYFSSVIMSREDLEKQYQKDEGFMFDTFKDIFDFVVKSQGVGE